jgi:hypothetical protein
MPKYKVWYAKEPTFRSRNLYWMDLAKTHTPLIEIEASDLENVYCRMQAENWSPNGESREMIKSLGLHHTSMSVGDVVEDLEDGAYHQVMSCGFERF